MGSVAAVVPAIANDLGISAFIVGGINWAYMLPYGLVALVYGPLTRRFDNKHIAVISLLLFSLFSLLSGCAWNYRSLFVFRFMVGVFAAAITPLSLIYIADHAHSSGRGKAVGLFFSATFIADLLGLFLSGIIAWRAMFYIPAVLGLGTAFLTMRHFPKTLAGRSLTSSRYLRALAQPEILRVFVYIFIISVLYHGVRQWLGVYFASQLGMSQFLISMTLTAASLAGIFGEAFGGLQADKKGRVPTLKAGLLLMTVSLFLMLGLRSAVVLPVLMLMWGFGWTVNHAGLSTFLTDLNKEFIKEVSSLNSSVRFVAGGLGVVAAGSIMQKSFNAGFLIMACVLSLMYFATDRILLRRKI